MKKSFLFLAALALVSVAACQKIETPETPDTPEVVAPEEKPETALNAEEVAYILNDVAEKEEVKLFIKKMIFMVREGNDSRHFEFSVGPQSENNPDLTYISGALGLVRGELHPIVVDMDLMIMSQIPIVGQLDPAQITKNYAKAGLSLDDITCEYYLYQAWPSSAEKTKRATARWIFTSSTLMIRSSRPSRLVTYLNPLLISSLS